MADVFTSIIQCLHNSNLKVLILIICQQLFSQFPEFFGALQQHSLEVMLRREHRQHRAQPQNHHEGRGNGRRQRRQRFPIELLAFRVQHGAMEAAPKNLRQPENQGKQRETKEGKTQERLRRIG